jgi:glycosyltransferase involved in cell wall biosynthesis
MIYEAASSGLPIQLKDAERRWIEQVLGCRWVTANSEASMAPVLTGQNEVAIGSYKTTLEAVIAARPNASDGTPLEFCITYDGWKVLPLKLFRPLVYYAAFGSDDIFACLRAAVISLLEFGRWSYDIAILTRSEDLTKVNAIVADLNLGGRLHIATVPGTDILDWCLARYQIDAAEVFSSHQPILYLDVDVICDAPLDDFFLKLIHSHAIEVLPEWRLGESGPDSNGNWFGWRLMAADGLIFDPSERGFSSGVLGFANRKVAGDAFSVVVRSAYCHAEQIGTRHHFEGYDQPFACYVMKKLGLISNVLLPTVARLCRVDPATSPLPIPVGPLGLVHFHGLVGHAASKRQAMEHYISLLVSRRQPPDASSHFSSLRHGRMTKLRIDFGIAGNYRDFNPVGFSINSDPRSTWTSSRVAELSFDSLDLAQNPRFEVEVSPFSASGLIPAQDCWVFVNGQFAAFQRIKEHTIFSFTVPLDIMRQQRNRLSFVLPNAATPSELGTGDDLRTLGLRFVRLAATLINRAEPPLRSGTEPDALPRALVIDDSVPEPDKDAGSNAMFQHILSLQRLGYAVTFIPGDNMAKIDPYTAELQRRDVECLYYPDFFSVEEVFRKRSNVGDLIYLHRCSNAAKYGGMIRQHFPKARILYSVADLHFLRLQRQAELLDDPFLRKKAEQTRRIELGAMSFVDCVIVHSSVEAELLRKLVPGLDVRVIPWTVVVADATRTPIMRPSVAFIGGYRHEPNVDAARWAVEQVMPLLREQVPGVELLLVGSHMPPEISSLAAADIVLLGYVPSLDSVFDLVRLTIAPLRFGAGLKGKVLESLAAGVPCVMTPIAAEGLGLPAELQSLVADGPRALTNRIATLCRDTAEYQRIAGFGKDFVRTTFSAERIDALLRKACDLA